MSGIEFSYGMRGHQVYWDGDEWRHVDDHTPLLSGSERPCVICGRAPTAEGHDACLGTLPGVMAACCGHGQTRGAYVLKETGTVLRGLKALDWMRRHGAPAAGLGTPSGGDAA